MILTTLVPSQPGAQVGADWRDRKERDTERMLRAADARFPGLREHLRFTEGATPRTLERYTRNTGGAAYGFAVTPNQVGPGRPAVETEVAGLYLAGHWAQPGGGVYGVVASGTDAARRILGCPTRSALWSELQ
jgi:prolycopene isomerase